MFTLEQLAQQPVSQGGLDPFEAYAPPPEKGKRAPLTGPIPTRAKAKTVYSQIVQELNACGDRDTLDIYLMTVGEELLQFERELEFLWEGDGDDFIGLQNEISQAKARLDGDTGAYTGNWS